jgi:hypothetical protein
MSESKTRHFGKVQRLISQRPDIHQLPFPRPDFIQRSIEERVNVASPNRAWFQNIEGKIQFPTIIFIGRPKIFDHHEDDLTRCRNLDYISNLNQKIKNPVEIHQKLLKESNKGELSREEYH